jgi:hypothetical protein
MLKILEITILNRVSNILKLIQYDSFFINVFLIFGYFMKHLKLVLKIFYFLFQTLDYLLIVL